MLEIICEPFDKPRITSKRRIPFEGVSVQYTIYKISIVLDDVNWYHKSYLRCVEQDTLTEINLKNNIKQQVY